MKRKILKRSFCVLLCVLMAVPLMCQSAFAVRDTDPQDGKFAAGEEKELFSLNGSQGYTDTVYEHDSRFATDYAVVDMIDVSKHQGEIDWAKVSADGIKNVMIRAGYRGSSQGTLNTDERFSQNVQGALAAGLRVGIYFFTQAINETEAAEEADYVLNLVRSYNITLPIAYDCEYASDSTGYIGRFFNAKLGKDAVTANCIAFANRIRSGGYKPMVYANPYMFSTVVDNAAVSRCCPVWLAAYRTKANFDGDYMMWQYSSKGSVDGISTNVDLSFWYIGTADAAYAKGIDITASQAAITVGATAAFAASANLGTLDKIFDSYTVSEVKWSSSDETVLTIDAAGNVTAVAAGNATVKASVTVMATVNGTATEYTYEDSKAVSVTTRPTSIFSIILNFFVKFIRFIPTLISAISEIFK